tara:strand:- start:2029 stop:2433 length:405 start_codon:yes stop_codon:yes gene_type:complete
MEESRRKYNFVKKEKQLDTNGWVQSATRYCNTHGNGRIYPRGVVDGINVNYETRPRPEISPVEEVIVERVLSPEILRTYGNQREELITTIKQDMAKELGSLLLESGYVVSVESIIPENFNTKIKMMVKTKKLEQ